MFRDEHFTSETAQYLRAQKGGEAVQVEMVTDDLLQVVITFDLNEKAIGGGVWLLALAVDVVADRVERETGHPFRAFCLMYRQARDMIEARKLRDRKDASGLLDAPF